MAGDVGHSRGTHVSLRPEDGVLVIGEGGYDADDKKLGVGGWYYTKTSDDFTRVDASGRPERGHQQGAYVVGQYPLYREAPEQGLVALAHIGIADDDVDQFDVAWYGGLVYTGLIPGRDADQIGLALSGAHNGDNYRQAARLGGQAVDASENTVELAYSAGITPWLSLKPDVQYVINPGTDKTLDNALVLGTRLTIDF